MQVMDTVIQKEVNRQSNKNDQRSIKHIINERLNEVVLLTLKRRLRGT